MVCVATITMQADERVEVAVFEQLGVEALLRTAVGVKLIDIQDLRREHCSRSLALHGPPAEKGKALALQRYAISLSYLTATASTVPIG